MTAYIDNITIVGTPKEIQEFIELRKESATNANTPYWMDITYWGGYMEPNTGGSIDITGSDLMNSSNAWFQNDNVEFKK